MKDKQDTHEGVQESWEPLEFRYEKYTVLKNRRKGKKFLMVDIKLPIPKIPDDPDPMELTLKSGNQLFIVGPNGSGKSALIQRLVAQDSSVKIRRIAAHRQTWFDSGKD